LAAFFGFFFPDFSAIAKPVGRDYSRSRISTGYSQCQRGRLRSLTSKNIAPRLIP
jgi:hypothetical protein